MRAGMRRFWGTGAALAARRGRRPLRAESLESRQMLAGDLAITEINYNPTDPTPAETAGLSLEAADFEYLEFKNIGDMPLNLLNYRFTEGIDVTLGNVTLQPGELGVVVRNSIGFARRYGTDVNVIGTFSGGSLSNSGEQLLLVDNTGATVVDFEYDDGGTWPTRADGDGSSLELIDPNTPKNRYEKPYSWRSSTEPNGSPGVENMGQIPVIINEVSAHTDEPNLDSIELLNISDEPVDIGGWWLSDSGNNALKYQIPAGTEIMPGEYLVFDEDDFNPNHPQEPGPNEFRLGSTGDDVWLTIGSVESGVTAFVDTVEFDGSLNGVTYGRIPDTTGRLVPTSRATLGDANSEARIGPLVISEFNYNAGPESTEALAIYPALTGSHLEFVEIHNPTTQAYTMGGWRLRGAIDFDFNASSTIEPDGTLVVVSFNPNLAANTNLTRAFRTQYGISDSVTLLGPWDGGLSNNHDRLVLQFADTADDPMDIPQIVADEVVYDDENGWPEEADGDGPTLQRVAPSFFGGSVHSWHAADPTPGSVTYQGGVPFDLNGDQVVDARDVDLLFDVTRYGNVTPAPPVAQLGPTTLDFDDSLGVGEGDVTAYLATAFNTRAGDANLDGFVDGSDFNVWLAHRFTPGNHSWADGDFNGDGIVDASDFNIWNANRFTSGPSGAAAQAARVPRAAAAGRPAAVVGDGVATAVVDRLSENVTRPVQRTSSVTSGEATARLDTRMDDATTPLPRARLQHARLQLSTVIRRGESVDRTGRELPAHRVDAIAAQWGENWNVL